MKTDRVRRILIPIEAGKSVALRGRRAFLDSRLSRTRGRIIEPSHIEKLDTRPLGGGWVVAGCLRHLARSAAAIGHHDSAATLLQYAVRMRPTDADMWFRLGEALSAGGPVGPTNLTLLGVTARPVGNLKAAAAAYRRADRLTPSPATMAAVCRVRRDDGDLVAATQYARDAVKEFPGEPLLLDVLAHCLSEHGRQRGGLTRSQVDELTHSWTSMVERGGPLRSRARFHLIRHAIRFQDWSSAYAIAAPGTEGPPTIDEVCALVADVRSDRSPDWWYVASWHLRAAGRFSTGNRARQREASVRLEPPLPPIPTLEAVRVRIQALVVLGRLDEAHSLIERAQLLPDPSGRLSRLAADLAVRSGDVAPLAAWAASHRTGLPDEPELRFRELIGGRAVGIVGPNASDTSRDDLARRCDVLVETKRLTATQSTVACPRISYYADTSAALFDRSIISLLDSQELQLAVFRPTNAGSKSRLISNSRVRIMPAEDSLPAGVSHYGVARIVYDVLRTRPRSVTLAGVDMFTSPIAYPDSYTTDLPVYDDAEFVRVLAGFNHDLADDHDMLSALWAANVINADDTTSEVLALDLVDYLRLLDKPHND